MSAPDDTDIKVIRVIQQGIPGPTTIRTVDLGIINSADVQTAGFIELIPYADGRIIEEVFFTPDQFEAQAPSGAAFETYLGTPNTLLAAPDKGMGLINPTLIQDTVGLLAIGAAPILPPNGGNPLGGMRIRDTGPLYVVSHQYPSWYGAWSVWTANTHYALFENVAKNGFNQAVTTGGVSGNSEPAWNNTPNGTTNDGTVVWTNSSAIATAGKIHVGAKVIEGFDTSQMQRIGGLVFVQQPTNVTAGGTIDPPVTVKVLDQSSNTYTMLPVFVSLYILGAGTLTGGDAVLTSNGIATFDSLSIAEASNGYVLRARALSSINISPVDSTPFNVT